MKRIQNLDWYQKGILLLLASMAVVFGVAYSIVISQVGFLYQEQIFKPSRQGSDTVYSGIIHGTDGTFTVTPDKTVTFRFGERVYGPYTVTEDAAAIPEEDHLSDRMTGIELWDGDEIRFRGGVYRSSGENAYWILASEDGTDKNMIITATMSDGTVVDGAGNVIDPMEPSVSTILTLMNGPELTHKGEWVYWILGVFFSVVVAASILFVDELFRLNLMFRIRDVESAEPSEWELASRYIGWTILAVVVLVFYITGLRMVP